jgi:Uma2 family endonuclease
MIYLDGSLTLLTKSHRHEWFVECLSDLVKAVATGLDIAWEPAGETTFRRQDVTAGLEGDATFYLDENAGRVHGPRNIDLAIDPPPDLAIEVEVTHRADDAMTTYGRLGVPEVWRFEADSWKLGFWLRRDDGTYAESSRSAGLSVLEPRDVVEQLRLADALLTARWYAQLGGWVAEVLVSRHAGN